MYATYLLLKLVSPAQFYLLTSFVFTASRCNSFYRSPLLFWSALPLQMFSGPGQRILNSLTSALELEIEHGVESAPASKKPTRRQLRRQRWAKRWFGLCSTMINNLLAGSTYVKPLRLPLFSSVFAGI